MVGAASSPGSGEVQSKQGLVRTLRGLLCCFGCMRIGKRGAKG